MNRRELLRLGAGSLGGLALMTAETAQCTAERAPHLRVVQLQHEVAPEVTVPTLAAVVLGQGASGVDVPVRVHNATGSPITLRSAWWDRDLALPPGGRASCRMNRQSGSATFSVSNGPLRVRGQLALFSATPGNVDADYALSIHHWQLAETVGTPRYATLGPRLLAASEPLTVRTGQRVRFQFFNASARWPISLHLPGHQFEVQALDEFPLVRPVSVAHLELAPGERIDTIVAMQQPGRWVLGSLSRFEQQAGFGRVIQYAGARGVAVTPTPAPVRFSHAQFAFPTDPAFQDGSAAHDIVLDTDRWDQHPLQVEAGLTQRLIFSNMTRTTQVVAVRGHRVELRQSGSSHVGFLHKDTLAIGPFARVAVHCVPDATQLQVLRL